MPGTLTFSAAEIRKLYTHSLSAKEHSPCLSQTIDPSFYKGGKLLDKDGKEVKVDRSGFPVGGNWPDSGRVDRTKVPPGLWLVGDQGVYLMSNGLRGLMVGDANSETHFVAYADECNPNELPFDDWYEAKERIFGRDDGCDYLPLSMFENVLSLSDDAKVKVNITANKIKVTVEEPKASFMRMKALKLMKDAQALDGLKPMLVMHEHEYGTSGYIGWTDKVNSSEFTEDMAASILDSKFDPDREMLHFEDSITLEELTGVSESSRMSDKPAKTKKPRN